MTFGPNFSLGNFLPEQIELPDDKDQFREELKRILEDFAKMINRKDTGQYEPQELQVNQTFPGVTQQKKRYIFRKFISLGILATGVNNVLHNISTGGAGSTYVFTKIYGVVYSQATPLWVAAPNDNIHLEVTATQVSITIPGLYNNYQGLVVLEFYKA
jgi:hypothetical protein